MRLLRRHILRRWAWGSARAGAATLKLRARSQWGGKILTMSNEFDVVELCLEVERAPTEKLSFVGIQRVSIAR